VTGRHDEAQPPPDTRLLARGNLLNLRAEFFDAVVERVESASLATLNPT
jgi:hypothetical protein